MQNSSKGNNSWKNHRTRTRRWMSNMHIHLPYLIFPWSFNEIRLVVSENSRGHEQYPIYLCRTHQRAITLGKIIEPEHAGDMRIHLWYLIFPLSFIEIRQAVSENLRGQERDGRTDARMKRRLYAPPKFFGEHNKKSIFRQVHLGWTSRFWPLMIYLSKDN